MTEAPDSFLKDLEALRIKYGLKAGAETLEERVAILETIIHSDRKAFAASCVVTGLMTLEKIKMFDPTLYEGVVPLVIGFNELQMHHMAEGPGIADYHKKPNADGTPRSGRYPNDFPDTTGGMGGDFHAPLRNP